MVNKKRLIALARSLIRIDSQNPPGDERKIASFVCSRLSASGLRPRVVSFEPNRPNVIARLKGKDSRRSLLISPHLDTVPSGKSWKLDPLGAVVRAGRLYGLGATDCKCNIACALEALQSITEEKLRLPYDLIFAATADEECGSSLGLIPLLQKKIIRPDAALVLDADDFDIIVAQKGLIHLKVRLKGKRCHGAYPWRGKNAIDAAVKALNRISSLKLPSKKNAYLRPPTVNIGTIRGGDKVNIVADLCEFELDIRFLPGTSHRDFLGLVRKALSACSGDFDIEVNGIQQPYTISPSHPLVRGLRQAFRESGLAPRIKGSEGATVITFFQHEGIPAAASGFGNGGQAHSADEFVKVNNLYKGAKALEEFLKRYH
jgi:succinyl-diaminopimelate desuccinylase